MSRGRLPIALTLIAALVLSAATRHWARVLRIHSESYIPMGQASDSSLASMDSFALALLLGGLRGPLVMMLWTSSESQKSAKDLEDFDTKVEWIRLLQPEFDTVHIFEVWNKAYNISVQMVTLANKYSAILDAIDYAQSVEAQRPNDINMIYAIGGIYFEKLGNSTEKRYYRKRVRAESLPHPMRQRLSRGDPGWHRLELDPVLDSHGMILPQFLKKKYKRPAGVDPSEWNTGAELQYLAKYQPFPYGISTFGFAYNYYKRAQVMQTTLKLHHAQMSPMVVDSRPALSLKNWEEAEIERGRMLELTAFNQPIPDDRAEMDLPTADLAVDAPFSANQRGNILAAIESYERAARLGPDAIVEYRRHLKNFSTNFQTYQSHMAECQANSDMARGDGDYLKAMLARGNQQRKFLAEADQAYRKALNEQYRVIFRFYIDDALAAGAFPKGIRRTNIKQLPSALYPTVLRKIDALSRLRQYDQTAGDRHPYENYVARIQARLKRIESPKKGER